MPTVAAAAQQAKMAGVRWSMRSCHRQEFERLFYFWFLLLLRLEETVVVVVAAVDGCCCSDFYFAVAERSGG